jgi:hypothetical protein
MNLIESHDLGIDSTYRIGSLSTIKILTGNEVLSLIDNEDFKFKWDHLYQVCPWATVFQSMEFVSTWYKLYHQTYSPILLMTEQENQLTGLLTLALPRAKDKYKKHFIVGAGHHEADYQTWLATTDYGDLFISAALHKVKELFPHNEVMLRHLPSNTPTAWRNNSHFWRKHCVMQPLSCPLIDLSEFSVSKRDRKRISRLKTISCFTKVTEEKDFLSILPELAVNYDFRQGAMFNKNPFRNDPLNEKLLLALFRQNLLHLTVLKSDQVIIAAVATLIGKNKAHLGGINFHSPLYADYSPGFVHFLMLGQQLAAEGIESFDLTPGGDAYKDRLATNHERVHILVTTYSRLYHYKRLLRNHLYRKLLETGIRPMTVELHLKRYLYTLKDKNITKLLLNRVTKSVSKHTDTAYAIPKVDTITDALHVQQDSLSDLLDFESKGTSLTRWDFLEDAMRRLEAGEHSFTLARGGRLLAYAWLRAPKAGAQVSQLTLPEGAAVLHGIYCHPDFLAQSGSFLLAVTQEILKERTDKYLVAFINKGDHTLSKSMALSGYEAISCSHLNLESPDGVPRG